MSVFLYASWFNGKTFSDRVPEVSGSSPARGPCRGEVSTVSVHLMCVRRTVKPKPHRKKKYTLSGFATPFCKWGNFVSVFAV